MKLGIKSIHFTPLSGFRLPELTGMPPVIPGSLIAGALWTDLKIVHMSATLTDDQKDGEGGPYHDVELTADVAAANPPTALMRYDIRSCAFLVESFDGSRFLVGHHSFRPVALLRRKMGGIKFHGWELSITHKSPFGCVSVVD